jgi:Anti-sigma-28 factor, FlgM
MQNASLEDLKRRIAAGEYAVDSGQLAGAILSKLALVRRVGRFLASEAEGAAGEARRGARPRTRGGSPASSPQPRREQLP